MKKLLVLVVAVGALVLPALAAAHPLGNFTINRYSRIQPSGDRVFVLYVLDMAEIPTFQAKARVGREGAGAYARALAADIARRLRLSADGSPLPLRVVRHVLAFPPGQAGLRTTRLEVLLSSPALAGAALHRLAYRDGNFPDRIGWKEIVVSEGAGADLRAASAPSASISQELLAYPKNLLQSPLDVTRATATFTAGTGPGVPPPLLSRQALDRRVGVRAVADGGFASLIARDHLSFGFLLLSLVLALFWGAAHALSPGHGKSVITAYLIGSRGTPRHAVALGLTTTITHTIGVFGLGLVTLALSEFILPEQLYPWLNLVSALLVVGVGLGVLRWRLREWRHRRARADGARHVHHHGHGHSHSHGHSHGLGVLGQGRPHRHAEPGMSMRSLVAVGVSGGIIPCPSALVVLLAAISLHRIGYGLVLILAFSVGLAAAITGIGMLAVTAKRLFNRVDFEGGLLRLVPAVSAVVIVGLGVAMTARALPHVV